MSYNYRPMTPEEKKEHVKHVACTCQKCMGMGGHGIHSSIGTKHEFWQVCSPCNGTGERKP